MRNGRSSHKKSGGVLSLRCCLNCGSRHHTARSVRSCSFSSSATGWPRPSTPLVASRVCHSSVRPLCVTSESLCAQVDCECGDRMRCQGYSIAVSSSLGSRRPMPLPSSVTVRPTAFGHNARVEARPRQQRRGGERHWQHRRRHEKGEARARREHGVDGRGGGRLAGAGWPAAGEPAAGIPGRHLQRWTRT